LLLRLSHRGLIVEIFQDRGQSCDTAVFVNDKDIRAYPTSCMTDRQPIYSGDTGVFKCGSGQNEVFFAPTSAG
jgi:hypothetical protein